MANITSNTVSWRVRAGGNNANGGGYDPSVSGVLSTTLNGAIASGATTVVVASATGWPSSGNYYARIGNTGSETFSSGATGSSEVVLVTAGQGTTSWTVTRAQLGTTAQAFSSGVVVDNELSRCDTAIATGTAGTSNNSTTFSDVGLATNLTLPGNVLWLASGTNGTAGPYIIQSVTNATTIVLDRACSSAAMTNGVWKIGGAWVSPFTNVSSSANIIPGNIIYVRAGGSGSVASPDYTVSSQITIPNGNTTTGGNIRVIGENGRPFLKVTAASSRLFSCGEEVVFDSLYGIATSSGDGIWRVGQCTIVNCAGDQNGFDAGVYVVTSYMHMFRCEAFSSTANAGAAGTQAAIQVQGLNGFILGCNVHDTWGPGIDLGQNGSGTGHVVACQVVKTRGDGIRATFNSNTTPVTIAGCTIDGTNSRGNGIIVTGSAIFSATSIVGNIISNFTFAGTYGLNCSFQTQAQNDRLRRLIDYNVYYNNTTNANLLTVGSGTSLNGAILHDTIGVDPAYTSISTEDYTPGASMAGLGFPPAFINSLSGATATVTNHLSGGAVQPAGSAAASSAFVAVMS